MTPQENTREQDLPKWKRDLILEAQRLIALREENQRRRQEFLETQPPEIRNTSIGK